MGMDIETCMKYTSQWPTSNEAHWNLLAVTVTGTPERLLVSVGGGTVRWL
jgi:hypothetical protein